MTSVMPIGGISSRYTHGTAVPKGPAWRLTVIHDVVQDCGNRAVKKLLHPVMGVSGIPGSIMLLPLLYPEQKQHNYAVLLLFWIQQGQSIIEPGMQHTRQHARKGKRRQRRKMRRPEPAHDGINSTPRRAGRRYMPCIRIMATRAGTKNMQMCISTKQIFNLHSFKHNVANERYIMTNNLVFGEWLG